MTEETKAADGAPAGVSDSTQLLGALSKALIIMHSLEAERLAHNKCLYDALLELPSGYREIPWEKYNELMQQWRQSTQPYPKST